MRSIQSIASKIKGFDYLLLIALFGSQCLLPSVESGCRVQERNACETICQYNSTTKGHDCILRAIVILPKTNDVETSLSRVSNDIVWIG